jgi:hypothetical protein
VCRFDSRIPKLSSRMPCMSWSTHTHSLSISLSLSLSVSFGNPLLPLLMYKKLATTSYKRHHAKTLVESTALSSCSTVCSPCKHGSIAPRRFPLVLYMQTSLLLLLPLRQPPPPPPPPLPPPPPPPLPLSLLLLPRLLPRRQQPILTGRHPLNADRH